MSPQQWFIQEDGREVGPFTPSELRDLVRAGRITRVTPVRPAQRLTFVAAGTVSGLLPPESAPQPELPAELFETDHPRHEVEPLLGVVQLDPAARAEDLFENHAPTAKSAAISPVAVPVPAAPTESPFVESAPKSVPRRPGPSQLAPASASSEQ